MTHVGRARFLGEIELIFIFGAASGVHFLLGLLSRKRPDLVSAREANV
jgi:hypothetical protein